jgi:hypothetical protein
MTAAIYAAHSADSEFRIGRVFNRTSSVLSRNFLTFVAVMAVAYLPTQIFKNTITVDAPRGWEVIVSVGLSVASVVLTIAFSTLGQAIVLFGAFENMRGRKIDLPESLRVGVRRLFPIIGLAIWTSVLGMLAAIAFIIPAFVVFTMWFVAAPICVVEQLGPYKSMRRSGELIAGHGWAIFGLIAVLFLINGIASQIITATLTAIGGTPLALVGELLWNGVWGAFYAISVVVTYYDLRAAKEGVDIDQIASAFD